MASAWQNASSTSGNAPCSCAQVINAPSTPCARARAVPQRRPPARPPLGCRHSVAACQMLQPRRHIGQLMDDGALISTGCGWSTPARARLAQQPAGVFVAGRQVSHSPQRRLGHLRRQQQQRQSNRRHALLWAPARCRSMQQRSANQCRWETSHMQDGRRGSAGSVPAGCRPFDSGPSSLPPHRPPPPRRAGGDHGSTPPSSQQPDRARRQPDPMGVIHKIRACHHPSRTHPLVHRAITPPHFYSEQYSCMQRALTVTGLRGTGAADGGGGCGARLAGGALDSGVGGEMRQRP